MATTPKTTATKAKTGSKAPARKSQAISAGTAVETVAEPAHAEGNLVGRAGEKAREYANKGKDRATGALDEVSEMIGSVAFTIDEKVGVEYGDYVRKAAQTVSDVAETLKTKDVDDLVADVRTFVKEKPAVAIGAAATVGFILTRIAKAGSSDRSDA